MCRVSVGTEDVERRTANGRHGVCVCAVLTNLTNLTNGTHSSRCTNSDAARGHGIARTEPFRELRRVAVVIGLRSHRRGVCVSGHGTDVLAYARTEDVERETDGM